MTLVNVSLPDFSGGEISKDIYGRHDLSVFYRSGRRVENFITDSTGPARFRTGLIYAGRSRANAKPFLFNFSFGLLASYVLEFTAGYIRFWKDGGLLLRPAQAITGITRANPAVVTYDGGDTFANGESVIIDGVVGMTEVNGREFIVANVNVGANTFELSGVNSSAYTAYTSGGTLQEIVQLVTPYTEAQLPELKFAQNGKKLYIAHPTHNPKKITYTSATSWAIADHAPTRESFSDFQRITGITQASPAVVTYTGADTFTAGDFVLISGVSGMTEVNDRRFKVGTVVTGAKTFELLDEDSGANINSAGYTAYSSGGIVQKVIFSAAPFLTAGEYPACVGLYEDRLIYAGSNNAPTTLYFSRSADEDDFTIGTEPDDGIEYVVAGDIGSIYWLRGTKSFLSIGAHRDVLQATGGVDDVITPTSISIRPTNSYGALNINPMGKGTSIYYLQANGIVVRSFEYDLSQDAYVPIDRNTVASHILLGGAAQIDFKEGRPNILLVPRSDGQLAALTIEEGEAVSGWHRHTTQGLFISATTLPRTDDYDQGWFAVKRVVDGATVYNIEYMADVVNFPNKSDYADITRAKATNESLFRNVMFEKQKEYIHVDSAVTYDGSVFGAENSITMTPSATSGSSVSFTASAATFSATDVGRQIWRKSITGAEFGRAEIIGYTSSTVVSCVILEAFNSTDAIPAGEWYLTSDSLSGAEHLEGCVCRVIADGGQHPEVTVEDGIAQLSIQASVVHIGLGYNGYLETNELEGGGTNGVVQTKQKSAYKFGVRLFDSLYFKIGTTYYNLDQIEFRTAAMRMDRPPEMFTGDVVKNFPNDVNGKNGGYDTEKRAIIVQDQPFPCNVSLIVPYMSVSN